jgi:hypothetical protein
LSRPARRKATRNRRPCRHHLRANPVDIPGDADPARYAAALEGLIASQDNDAIWPCATPPMQSATKSEEDCRGHKHDAGDECGQAGEQQKLVQQCNHFASRERPQGRQAMPVME